MQGLLEAHRKHSPVALSAYLFTPTAYTRAGVLSVLETSEHGYPDEG